MLCGWGGLPRRVLPILLTTPAVWACGCVGQGRCSADGSPPPGAAASPPHPSEPFGILSPWDPPALRAEPSGTVPYRSQKGQFGKGAIGDKSLKCFVLRCGWYDSEAASTGTDPVATGRGPSGRGTQLATRHRCESSRIARFGLCLNGFAGLARLRGGAYAGAW